jgi:hypothetical protein
MADYPFAREPLAGLHLAQQVLEDMPIPLQGLNKAYCVDVRRGDVCSLVNSHY